MNCGQATDQLYEQLDRELSDDELAALEEHLKDCAACRRERDALERDRRALGSVETPSVRIDVAALYRREALQYRKAQRRWRRWAVVACAASVLLAAVLMAGLRIEINTDRVVLSWGDRAVPVDDAADGAVQKVDNESAPRINPSIAIARHERRLIDLEELIGLVAVEIDRSRARERRLILAALRNELNQQRRDQESRMKLIGRSVHALHLAQLSSEEQLEGELP